MLTLYDPSLETRIPDLQEAQASVECRFLGSDLKKALGYDSEEEFEDAVATGMRACAALGLPLHDHFRPVFRCEESGLIRDMRLSVLGCYFVTIHAEPSLPSVARAQLFFLTHTHS